MLLDDNDGGEFRQPEKQDTVVQELVGLSEESSGKKVSLDFFRWMILDFGLRKWDFSFEAFLSSTDDDDDHYHDHVLRASFRSGVGMFLDTSASSSHMR